MDVQAAFNAFKSNIGKALDFDGQFGPQCVDEIQFWAKALGKRPFSGNAINIFGENPDQWTWVYNSPSGVPPVGAIIVYYANNAAVGTGPYAHVDLADAGATTSSFNALDQNWGGVQRVEEIHHPSYAGVLGWGIPIEDTPPSTFTVEAIRATNVRSAPTTASAIAGSGLLQPGNTFTAVGVVTGQNVSQNGVTSNQWYHSQKGNFVWAGNCKRL